MTIIMPEGEMIRKAVRWISEEREGAKKKSLITLIEEAGKNFDLSPKECDFLIHFFTVQKEEGKR
jgi:hypothetical protein